MICRRWPPDICDGALSTPRIRAVLFVREAVFVCLYIEIKGLWFPWRRWWRVHGGHEHFLHGYGIADSRLGRENHSFMVFGEHNPHRCNVEKDFQSTRRSWEALQQFHAADVGQDGVCGLCSGRVKSLHCTCKHVSWFKWIGLSICRVFDGFIMVCNYHPKGNIPNQHGMNFGTPCSTCSMDRPTCSRIYKSLCGIGQCLNMYMNLTDVTAIWLI